MALSKHIAIWALFIVLMSIVGIPFINNYAIENVKTEVSYVSEVFGEKSGKTLEQRANDSFNFCCKDAADYTLKSFVLDGDGNAPSEFLSNVYNNIWGSIYQIIVRIHILVDFSLYLFPFVIAAFYDALQIRRVKTENKSWFSPLRYHAGLHACIAMFGGLIIYLLSPLAIHIYFLVGWFVLLGAILSWTFRNMQPKL